MRVSTLLLGALLFWLGQSGDPGALDLFEEILRYLIL